MTTRWKAIHTKWVNLARMEVVRKQMMRRKTRTSIAVVMVGVVVT